MKGRDAEAPMTPGTNVEERTIGSAGDGVAAGVAGSQGVPLRRRPVALEEAPLIFDHRAGRGPELFLTRRSFVHASARWVFFLAKVFWIRCWVGSGKAFGGVGERVVGRGEKRSVSQGRVRLGGGGVIGGNQIVPLKLQRGRWKNIILHHSATLVGNAARFDVYHRVKRRMENGLAYHFLIGNGHGSGDGEIEVGPRWSRQMAGGHVSSLAYNENSIGVCLIGNFEKQQPSVRQLESLMELLGLLQGEVLEGRGKLYLHREVKGERTLCPGRHFPGKRVREQFGRMS